MTQVRYITTWQDYRLTQTFITPYTLQQNGMIERCEVWQSTRVA